MKIPLIILLVGFLAGKSIVQAQSASGQYTISNPQVVLNNAQQSGKNSLQDRIGKSGIDQFVNTGGYTITTRSTSLDTKLSQGLLELEKDVSKPTEKIHLIHNGFMSIKSSRLQKDVTYKTIQRLNQSGTSTDIYFTVPNSSRNLNSLLGNIVISIYTY